MEKIGFLGLGIMGEPMSRNLAQKGYEVYAYNRTPKEEENFRQLVLMNSPCEVAEKVDVVVIMVTGPDAINSMLFGANGCIESLQGKVLINMSSVSPFYSRELNKKLEEKGVTLIDAPVSGSKKPAQDATLVILASGPATKVQEIEPILLAMGKKVVYCGETGQGSMMKMAINLLLGACMEGLAEMMSFGEKGGLSKESLLDVVLSGPMGCGLFQLKEKMLKEDNYPTQFPLKHMTKDLNFVVDTARQLKAHVPISETLLSVYDQALQLGLGDEDFAAIKKVLK